MTMRTFPIRVGNITDEDGNVTGWSGPVYPDQKELSWEEHFPEITPEKTTVTQRVRRIFTFSPTQYHESLLRLQPDYVHVGFCDYLQSAVDFVNFVDLLRKVEGVAGADPQRVYSFGPSTNDVLTYEQALNKYD